MQRNVFRVPYVHLHHISEVTKSHPEGDDDTEFSTDRFHKRTVAIKMKLPNSVPSQVIVRIVEIE